MWRPRRAVTVVVEEVYVCVLAFVGDEIDRRPIIIQVKLGVVHHERVVATCSHVHEELALEGIGAQIAVHRVDILGIGGPRRIGLADIAAATRISKSSLYVIFHNDLGKAPIDVLTQIRVNKAKQMLRETDEKVYTIAVDCGFGLVGNLYHHFKQATGMTTSEYRKQIRVVDRITLSK